MQCLICQTEIAEMHSFCPKCRALANNFSSQEMNQKRGVAERVWSQMTTFLLLGLIVGASVVIGRAIKWKEIVSDLERTGAKNTEERSTTKNQANIAASHKNNASAKRAKQTDKESNGNRMNVKYFEVQALPSPLGDGPIDPKLTSEISFVAINSLAPVRIFVNGQFSGFAPNTVRLIPGPYQIRLVADGYQDWSRNVHLKNKQHLGITATMREKSTG